MSTKSFFIGMFILFFNFCCSGKVGVKGDGCCETAGVVPMDVKPIVNVYIENSGSMDGYVNGDTEFKNQTQLYISEINNKSVASSLNLFYINNSILPQDKGVKGGDAWKKIDAFCKDLTPASFKSKGGKRTTTVFSNMFDNILKSSGNNTVSILISDFISDEPSLDAMKTNIKSIYLNHIKSNPNLAVCIYQMTSKFKGTYYCKDFHTVINAERPYYMWVIGDKQSIIALQKAVPQSKIGAKNVFTIAQGGQTVDYKIIPGTGNFNIVTGSGMKEIKSLKKGGGTANFTVNADFSSSLFDKGYLSNASNYEIQAPYNLSATVNDEYGEITSLKISTSAIVKTTLYIKLKNNIPNWIDEYTDTVGTKITAGGAMAKTYGLKYLIEGVFDAFTDQGNYYTELKISIK